MDFGEQLHGYSKSFYSLVFDSKFNTVVSGTATSKKENGEVIHINHFGDNIDKKYMNLTYSSPEA